jgi:hypothetical protein
MKKDAMQLFPKLRSVEIVRNIPSKRLEKRRLPRKMRLKARKLPANIREEMSEIAG